MIKKFEHWIIKECPRITNTVRYPNTIKTISNHLGKKGVSSSNLYSITCPIIARKLKDVYLGFDDMFELNKRGNHMYSRAFDLYIEFLDTYSSTFKQDIDAVLSDLTLTNTQKSILITSRVGQGKYRDKLVEYWNGCSVTGCKQIRLLVASHIKPWAMSNDDERLDLYNGFLLLPNIDKAFDKGCISFDSSGSILISSDFREFELFGVTSKMKILMSDKHQPYLDYHRQNIYENYNDR